VAAKLHQHHHIVFPLQASMEPLSPQDSSDLSHEKPKGPEWMSERPRKALEQLYKWTRFIGISGSIMGAFILLNGIALFANPQVAEEALSGLLPGVNMRSVAMVYILLGVLYFLPMRHLLRFSRQIESYFKREDAASAVEALISISTFFRFIGLVVLFFVGLYVLGLMASLVGMA
jgi:hypothetical protein